MQPFVLVGKAKEVFRWIEIKAKQEAEDKLREKRVNDNTGKIRHQV